MEESKLLYSIINIVLTLITRLPVIISLVGSFSLASASSSSQTDSKAITHVLKQSRQNTKEESVNEYSKFLESNKIKLEEYNKQNIHIIEEATKASSKNSENLSKQIQTSQNNASQLLNQVLQNQRVLSKNHEQNEYNQGIDKKEAELIICVSFSMPKEMLKSYLEQARIYAGRLVVRGLINNSFKQTVKALTLDKNQVLKIEINPKIFKDFNVTRVPTIIYISKEGKTKLNENEYYKFVGSVGIKYVLDEIGKFSHTGNSIRSISSISQNLSSNQGNDENKEKDEG